MANKIRRYWDSACCFGYLFNQAGRAEKCERILLDAEVGNCEIIISAWTLAELLHRRGAVHIATALSVNADCLETFDGQLIGKSKHLGGDPVLIVQEPGADLAKAEATAEKKQQLDLSGPFAG